MDRNEAASVIRRYLTCTDITHSCNGKCEACRYHTNDDEKELALKLAIKALEGGAETVEAIPVDWIEAQIPDSTEFYAVVTAIILRHLIDEYRKEQNNEQTE